MKKLAAIAVASFMAVSLLAGCTDGGSGDGSSAASDGSTGTAALTGTVKMSGSTSMETIAKALAEGFMAKNSGVTVDVQLGGSSVGVADAQSGKSDIGNVSRELKDTETGLKANEIAIDGIAVALNNDNPVKNLTKDQLTKIYTGEIKNWKEVGGEDAAIVVIAREASSGTREAFEDILGIKGKVKASQEKNETGAVKTAVQTTKNAIGYVSLEAIGDGAVTAAKIDGVEATEENIKSDAYILARPFVMATKESGVSDVAQAFIDYVLSDEGQTIVKNNKLISVK